MQFSQYNNTKKGNVMFSERLKIARKIQNLNQVELAEKLGVSKQSVSNWENDNIQPSIEVLIKISHALKVSSDYLLGIDTESYGKARMIDVSGLSEETIYHLQLIISDLKGEK